MQRITIVLRLVHELVCRDNIIAFIINVISIFFLIIKLVNMPVLTLCSVGKPGWENRWVDLDGSHLYLYLDDSRSNPVDTFDLSPLDADVSVQSAVTAVELSNTTSIDLYYVLRVDQDPLTTCWPGR